MNLKMSNRNTTVTEAVRGNATVGLLGLSCWVAQLDLAGKRDTTVFVKSEE